MLKIITSRGQLPALYIPKNHITFTTVQKWLYMKFKIKKKLNIEESHKMLNIALIYLYK
jgi:hypothetical protein